MITVNELRKKYLDFFKDKASHIEIPSSPLIPENDPTTLFTGSGMQPMIPYLLGEKHPLGTRIVDSQKCLRAEDIEDIGDNRHTTFFEMLGNWSLGDYFKQEQISWMFEFLTEELGLDPNRIYVTVFRGNDEVPRDEESVAIWQKLFAEKGIEAKPVDFSEKEGMKGGQIFYYDDTKNWWSRAGVPANMPVGEPGGPDTEMFWDFGAELKLHEDSEFKNDVCHVNCDCGRFMEIGNNVFMAYQRTQHGFEELSQKNVDFGGGLERMVAAVNDNSDVFKINVFEDVMNILENASGKKYGQDSEYTQSFRIIADHLRSVTFLLADGVLPSNKDQGYFSRRFLRRAIRYADHIGVKEHISQKVAESIINDYQEAYPILNEKRKIIIDEIGNEEDKFRSTLEKGLKEFEKLIKSLESKEIPGDKAFELFATYGFPLEMTEELAEEKGYSVDKEAFEKSFSEHQEISRQGSDQKFKGGLADHSEVVTKLHTATHLLHQALRDVLGDHVAQKGSNITNDRLRFDFVHGEKMTPDQIQEVEKIVNEQIQKNMPVSKDEMTVDEAKSQGAIGLFEHKYGEKVNVYTMGDYSKEICGGPHVENTGVLGSFKIKKEESSSAGIRRIKAILS